MPRTRHSEVATIGGNHTTGFPTTYPAAAAPRNREGSLRRGQTSHCHRCVVITCWWECGLAPHAAHRYRRPSRRSASRSSGAGICGMNTRAHVPVHVAPTDEPARPGDSRRPPSLEPTHRGRSGCLCAPSWIGMCTPAFAAPGRKPGRYSPTWPRASSLTMSRWPTWRAYSWRRWNKTRSSGAGSAPSHPSPGWPTPARSWDSTSALVRAACA